MPKISRGARCRLKKLYVTAATFCVIGLAGVLLGYLDLMRYATSPVASDSDEKIVIVDRGQSLKQTADTLHARGLITQPFKFRLLARLKGADKRIQVGEYLIASDLPPGDILDMMVSGRVRLYRFTVPEGSNLIQIADIIESAGLINRQVFLQSSKDPELLEKMGLIETSFEGYLFPDTYFFPKNARAEQIIEAMVTRLRAEISDAWMKRAAELGFSLHEVLTLASIIEKETGAPFERPLISSVFHNRLKKGMRLETDPTVIYGIEDFDGNLTRKHLETSTPYNTYLMKGLPPGPIASPGRASLEAALYPAESKFLFFVSKKDGTHQFSTNLVEHNRAIREYQLRR
jgi:UPF0755 protein